MRQRIIDMEPCDRPTKRMAVESNLWTTGEIREMEWAEESEEAT